MATAIIKDLQERWLERFKELEENSRNQSMDIFPDEELQLLW